jgi:hypothetical protein
MRKPRAARTLAISAALVSMTAVLVPIAWTQAGHGQPGHGQRRTGAGDVGTAVQQASRSLARLVHPRSDRDPRPGAPAHIASHGSTLAPSSGPPAATTASRHVLFGGTVPLVPEQPKVGHLGIVRTYYTLGQNFGGRTATRVMSHGSTMLISLDSRPSRGPSYASIAAGKHDAEIRSFLTQVEHEAVHYRIPAVYFAFEHEANSPQKSRLGTPAQFVAAWRHMHHLAAKARLNWNTGGRLHWVLILERMAYFTVAERPRWSLPMGFAANYFPGSSYVDGVGADGYNSGSCGTPKPSGWLQPGDKMTAPGAMFNPLLTFAQKHGNMPAFIAEWASIRYENPLVRPRFIYSMQEYVLAHPAIKATSYWDSLGPGARGYGGAHPAACSFSVNNDPRSLAALATMNHALHR